jgi:hypothetical protein
MMITFNIKTELLTLFEIAKKIIWWKRFFKSTRFDFMKKLHIRCDNRSTLRVLESNTLKINIKLKHVNIHRHWLKQKVQFDRINVNWISIVEMFADDFIKISFRTKHENFLKQLHLIDIFHLLINQRIYQAAKNVWFKEICWMMK